MAHLNISPEKVAFVILKAREFGAKVAPFDEGDIENTDEQSRGEGVLENRSDDPNLIELVEFIDGLNVDELTDLVALTWVGRGTFTVEDWSEAVRLARTEATIPSVRYLVQTPMLADYLEEGLAAFGINANEIESELLR